MPIKEVKPKYEVEGQSFDTKEEAERYEQIFTAHLAYKQAKAAFERAVAKSQKTADGYDFQFGSFHDYYIITPQYFHMPKLREISVYSARVEVGDDWGNPEKIVLYVRVSHGGDRKEEKFAIKDLYHNKSNAENALLAAQKEFVASLQEDVEKLEARLLPAS